MTLKDAVEIMKPMIVEVQSVRIPAMSTIGYGVGTDEDGNIVNFVGDHRPMRNIGEACRNSDEPIRVELESWQVQEVLSEQS